MVTLFGYSISPYAAKVRAVLRYKGIPFDERTVHPLDRKEVVRLSSQVAIPILEDGGQVVADSTRIVAWLDERYPARPVLPRDPALRARSLLLEEGFDEGLGRVVQPVRWMIAANARRTAARFRAAYGPGLVEDLRMALVSRFLRLDMRRKYGSRTLGAAPAATLVARLDELLDIADAALAETGWLAGPAPSVADFALFGWLSQLDGLEGWDRVQAHARVARLLQELAEPTKDTARAGSNGDAERPGRAIDRA